MIKCVEFEKLGQMKRECYMLSRKEWRQSSETAKIHLPCQTIHESRPIWLSVLKSENNNKKLV